MQHVVIIVGIICTQRLMNSILQRFMDSYTKIIKLSVSSISNEKLHTKIFKM